MPKKTYLSDQAQKELALSYLEDAAGAMKVALNYLGETKNAGEIADVVAEINKTRLALNAGLKKLREKLQK